jgi:short-subunit dehydrogenase
MAGGREFAGKVVWITGASSGIGRELAVAFSRRGARTVLSARRREALEETRRRCEGGDEHRIVTADMEDIDRLAERVEEAHGAFGRIDIAVMNAGLSQRAKALETDPAVVRRVNTVNFIAPTTVIRHLAPLMIEGGGGRIVGVSSLSTRAATPYRSAYTASKAALETYLTILRREVLDTGLEVTLALPGFVRTDISRHALGPDGNSHGLLDKAQEHGMPADECAARIIRGILRGRREILLPSDARTRLGMFLERWAPALLDRILAKAEVT